MHPHHGDASGCNGMLGFIILLVIALVFARILATMVPFCSCSQDRPAFWRCNETKSAGSIDRSIVTFDYRDKRGTLKHR